jgi:hypothetical protein
MSSMRQLMKQAQEMQERLQRELNELVVEASVGGGMVTVKMSGHKQLVGCKIDPEAMDPNDPLAKQATSSVPKSSGVPSDMRLITSSIATPYWQSNFPSGLISNNQPSVPRSRARGPLGSSS